MSERAVWRAHTRDIFSFICSPSLELYFILQQPSLAAPLNPNQITVAEIREGMNTSSRITPRDDQLPPSTTPAPAPAPAHNPNPNPTPITVVPNTTTTINTPTTTTTTTTTTTPAFPPPSALPANFIAPPPPTTPPPAPNSRATPADVLTSRLRLFFGLITCLIIPTATALFSLLIWMLVSARIDRGQDCDTPLNLYSWMALVMAVYTPQHRKIKRGMFDYERERDGPRR